MTDAREWLVERDSPGWITPTNAMEMRDALLTVLNLHREDVTRDEYRYCVECDARWPCPTVRAINDALGIGDDSRREGYECEW